MIGNAPGRSSRLLDALDSNAIMGLPRATTSSLRTPLQQPLHSTDKNAATDAAKEALMQARLKQLSQLSPGAEDNDVEFLHGAFNYSTRPMPSGGGFRVNYDELTPVRAIDIGGADQTQKIEEFVTSGFNNMSHGMTVSDAIKELSMKDKNDTIPGLEVRLLKHQIIGVAWMLQMEKSKHKGGILADDMGLGKTIQMIATMLLNMAKPDGGPSTTLVVVPAALLQQWKEEVEQKSGNILTVHVHHGKDKLKRPSQIKGYDVIITTYQTLNNDFHIPKDIDTTEETEWLAKHGGTLARCTFWRVIADEAQFIRNRGTQASVTMAHVKATHRWMLTGTPVTNSLADIYGLLRFGRFRPWNDWNDFNTYVCKVQGEDAVLAGQRARSILEPLILRRTKDAQLEGEPILSLKPKDIAVETLEFSAEEREVYKSFETRSKIRLNRFIKARTLIKNHAAVLVMILRLRQLCCHPNLILSQTDGYDDPSSLMGDDSEKELSRAIKLKGRAWVDKVKRRFLLRARASEIWDFNDEAADASSSCPVCNDVYQSGAGRVLGCGHEMCADCLDDQRNAPLAHDGIFGYGSEKENMEAEKRLEAAVAKGHRPCPVPTCKEVQDVTEKQIFRSAAFEPTDEELTRHAKDKRKKKKAVKYESSDNGGDVEALDFDTMVQNMSDSEDEMPDVSDIFAEPAKKKKKTTPNSSNEEGLSMDGVTASISTGSSSDIKGRKPKLSPQGKRKSRDIDDEGEGEEEIEQSAMPSEAMLSMWRKGDDDMEPSTKMKALVWFLKEWENTGDKTICYSQWTSMLDLIETLFSRHGIRWLRFDGKMDRASRDSVLKSFKTTGGPKIILISTKCGGVGLNLVSANRIINMDLSWNYAAESQAYDRAHRIGQEKLVWVKRLVVRDTIEERMLKLQDVKVGLAEAALGEGNGSKLHKLSMRDIKFLFGMTKTQGPPQGGYDEDEDRPAFNL